jgi:hypothetical protein
MADNLKAAAFQAGLSASEKSKVDSLSKALSVHQELLALPSTVAQQKFAQYTPAQQKDLVNKFGNESPEEKPDRSVLGTAWHYTGGKVFEALNFASDITTRAFRTGAIAIQEGEDLGQAWKEAGANGEKKFNPNRIEGARQKYGNAAVNVAMRIAGGEKPEEIMATATEEEKYYLQVADKTNSKVLGLEDDKQVQAARDLFDDTIASVNAAKYSPGRTIANIVDAIVPGDFYENGFFYKLVSGAGDAIWRLRTDPLLIAGKQKRLYDLRKYSYEVLVGDAAKSGVKFNQYFDLDSTKNFWDQYGAKLADYRKASAADNRLAAAEIRRDMERLAPEFGPSVVKMFNNAEISNVTDAKAFFLNSDEAFKITDGIVGRKRLIMPKLDAGRKLRVKTLTATNKVFNLDKIGPELVDNTFFGMPTTADGIYEALVDKPELLAQTLKGLNKKTLRLSSAQVAKRIDKAKRSLTPIPMFKNNVFDVTAKDAQDQIFRLAAMVMPTRESKLIAEVFEAAEETGRRKEIFYGLWNTIAEFRGLEATKSGQVIVRRLRGKGDVKFSVSRVDDYAEYPLLPSEMNPLTTAPSLVDIDRAASRSTLIQTMLGVANSKWVDEMTNYWSFLTLAGPRYAIRNAGEDLMINLAMGKSVWGLAKDRVITTRLNTAFQQADGLTAGEKWASNPLGIMMRFVNGKEAKKYTAEIDALEKTIKLKREKMIELNKIALSSKNKKAAAEAKAEFKSLSKEVEGGIFQQTQQIFARSLTEGRINTFRKQLGLDVMNKESIDLLTEQVIYGDIENLMSMVSEGGLNFASGGNYLDLASDFTKTMGVKSAELRLDLSGLKTKYATAAGSRGFREIGLVPNNEASMIAWLMRISFYGNDELGALAIANLTDDALKESQSIKKIFDYLSTPNGQQLMKDARLSAGKEIDQAEYARLVYARAKDVFTRSDNGKLNQELLGKIRTIDSETGEFVVSGKLSLDDLPTNPDDMPRTVVGPELVPVADTTNYTSPLMQKGWTWLGMSNARLSRQPLAINEMLDIRKEMKATGFEDAFIANYLKGIDQTDPIAAAKGLDNAKRELAKLVEERAVSQINAYVDNPLIRSQISFSVRNFARFYRAQEDFYRRMIRLVRYNPEAIQRAALTFDGVAHSGWVQEDDKGELYFVYPHFEAGYKAIQGALTALGVPQDFKVPFPVQFGGSVKMLTPSLNPDSILPSFAGPAAALPFSLLENVINFFEPGMGDNITRYTLGKYAVDQDLVSRLMPAHVNRALNTMNQDERNSQYASAYRKAVTYLEAAGKGIPKRYDQDGNLIPPTSEELETYRQSVRSTALGVLATRFVFGFLAPASPSVQLKSDMAEWIRDAGRANWKQAFNKLREQYNGDYDAAMAKWVELYPNQVPYTVTESERQTVATFGYAKESGEFVDKNKELFKDFPEAAAFLIPHKGAFSFDAYKTMTDMGLLKSKRVEDYLREVQTSSDLQVYYEKKNQYEESLKTAGADVAKRIIREQFNTWKSQFFAGRPLVMEELSGGSEKRIKKLNALDDLERMLGDTKYSGIQGDTQDQLRAMLSLYQNYQKQRDAFELTGASTDLTQAVKESTLARIKEMSKYNENTQAAFDVLFARLLD